MTPPGGDIRGGHGGSPPPPSSILQVRAFWGRAAPANPLRLRPEQLARLQLPPNRCPPGPPPPPSSMPRALCGARGSPRRRQPPPRQAGPGALINYLIFPLCLIYSPARLWPYAAFVVSGSLLWQAALAAQTPPPAFDPPTPPTPSSPATPQAPWRAPPGLGGVRGGGRHCGEGAHCLFFFPFPY